ncbi:MAG: thiamine phosphate synthase, partial [Sutterellaceae bacterium]|nr:thiamine phosphate synthase [Sutterellaceae bacterium]
MRPTIDLSLYLVLDPDLCGGFDGMVETSRIAAANGATVVQLRAPAWKKRELVECGRAIKTVLDPLNVPLIINDHADVCLAVDAAGLHVGQKDLAPADARAIIGPDKVLGLSVSNSEQLSKVDTTLVDHLGIGPIFATATKTDAAPQLGVEGFGKLASHKPCPVVAIGSVKANLA